MRMLKKQIGSLPVYENHYISHRKSRHLSYLIDKGEGRKIERRWWREMRGETESDNLVVLGDLDPYERKHCPSNQVT